MHFVSCVRISRLIPKMSRTPADEQCLHRIQINKINPLKKYACKWDEMSVWPCKSPTWSNNVNYFKWTKGPHVEQLKFEVYLRPWPKIKWNWWCTGMDKQTNFLSKLAHLQKLHSSSEIVISLEISLSKNSLNHHSIGMRLKYCVGMV